MKHASVCVVLLFFAVGVGGCGSNDATGGCGNGGGSQGPGGPGIPCSSSAPCEADLFCPQGGPSANHCTIVCDPTSLADLCVNRFGNGAFCPNGGVCIFRCESQANCPPGLRCDLTANACTAE